MELYQILKFGNGGFPDGITVLFKIKSLTLMRKILLIPGIRVILQLVISLQEDWTLSSFSNSVMTCDKSFVISTEHMSPDLLEGNNLL